MKRLRSILVIAALIVLTTGCMVTVNPGRDYPIVIEPPHGNYYDDNFVFAEGLLYIRKESAYERNTYYTTRIDFKGLTGREAENKVETAYWWWAEHTGRDGLSWFVGEARRQGVHIDIDIYSNNTFLPIEGISFEFRMVRRQ